MLNPGKYRHRIVILQQEPGKDDYGEPNGRWLVYKELWASKDPILGNEFFAALTQDTKIDVKFCTRFADGITDAMRIKHGQELYDIASVIDIGSLHKELLYYCNLVKE